MTAVEDEMVPPMATSLVAGVLGLMRGFLSAGDRPALLAWLVGGLLIVGRVAGAVLTFAALLTGSILSLAAFFGG